MGKGPKVPQSVATGQSNLASGLSSSALPSFNNASSYWNSLLQGGPAAQQAVAPYAEQIGQSYQGARQNIQNNMPQGGEKNLALEQIPIQQANQVSRLYAGMGPQAASSLGGLALGGAGTSANAGGSLLNLAGQQAIAKGQTLGGLGSGIGSIAGGMLGNKSGGSKGGGGGNGLSGIENNPGGGLNLFTYTG